MKLRHDPLDIMHAGNYNAENTFRYLKNRRHNEYFTKIP